MENSILQLIMGFLIVAVVVGIKDGYAFSVIPSDWPRLLFLGMVNTGVGCYLYFSTISTIPAQTVAVCSYLEPLSAVFFS